MNSSWRRAAVGSLLLTPVLAVAGARSLERFEAVEPHMGTLMRIELYAGSKTEAEAAFRAAYSRIAEIDRALTDYNPDSELNRICREAVGRFAPVSEDLYTVLSKAQEVSQETNGAFDVTIGAVSHLWRAARKSHSIPDAAALHEASLRCGYRKLHLDKATRSVRLDQPGMQLDLGGIAKGYAADQALSVLGNRNIQSALVAASGDVTFSAAPPDKPGWEIGVSSTQQSDAPFTRVLVLANGAVSTSGDREQHVDRAGRRYSHVIDPGTEQGLTNGLAVTVVARRGIEADASATAVDILGVRAGLTYIESRPALAALLTSSRPTSFFRMSKRFQRLPVATQGTN